MSHSEQSKSIKHATPADPVAPFKAGLEQHLAAQRYELGDIIPCLQFFEDDAENWGAR